MKKLAIIVASLMVTVMAYGQGQFLFDTSLNYPDGAVKAASGVLANSDYLGQIYGSTTETGSYAAVGAPVAFGDGDLAGYIISGIVTVSGVPGATDYWVQLRAWNKSAGATYEAATAKPVYEAGMASAAKLSLGGTTSGGTSLPPADLTGKVAAFQMTIVPEPSAIALGLLGAAALFLRRRS